MSKIILKEYIKPNGVPQKTAVRQALIERFQKIKIANGYWNDVAVYDSTKSPYSDESTVYPFIQIVSSDLEFLSSTGEAIQMKNTINVSCVVGVDVEIDDSELQLEKLEEDVLRCLFPDQIGVQPGAFNTLKVELSGIQYNPREAGNDEASFELTITFNTSITAKKES